MKTESIKADYTEPSISNCGEGCIDARAIGALEKPATKNETQIGYVPISGNEPPPLAMKGYAPSLTIVVAMLILALVGLIFRKSS